MKRIVFSLLGLGLIVLAAGCCHHHRPVAPACPPAGVPYGPFGATQSPPQPITYVSAAPACPPCQTW